MRTRRSQNGEGRRKSRAHFSPGGAGVESTAPNLFQPLRKRVADLKHGFESLRRHMIVIGFGPRHSNGRKSCLEETKVSLVLCRGQSSSGGTCAPELTRTLAPSQGRAGA